MKYLWFARWQGLEVNMHVDDDVVFWGWNTSTADQPPRLSTDGKKSTRIQMLKSKTIYAINIHHLY